MSNETLVRLLSTKVGLIILKNFSLKDEKEAERASLLQAGRLNLAMCMIKMNDWVEARNLCDKVIEENPSSVKGYFRRGEALVALNEHDLALRDFGKVIELDPENKAAKNKVAVCMHQIKVNKEKEKKTFANMFEKVKFCILCLFDETLYLYIQFARIDAKKAEDARKNQKPLEINEWDDGERSAEEEENLKNLEHSQM